MIQKHIKILLTGLAIFSLTTSNAQSWNLAGNSISSPSTEFLGTTSNQPLIFRTDNTFRMTLSNDGNLGIGDPSPTRKLMVSVSPATSDLDGIILTNTSGSSSSGLVMTGSPYPYFGVGANEAWLNSNATNLNIGPASNNSIKFVADGGEKMRMLSNGNFGIGTGSPAVSLDVNGFARATSLRSSGRIFSTGDATGDDLSTTSGAIVMTYDNVNNLGYLYSRNYQSEFNMPLHIYGSSVAINAVSGSGNVGVGIASPAYKLDVDGDINFPEANALKVGGINALKYLPTYQNFFIGENSGQNLTSAIFTADYNLFVGGNSGRSYTSGTGNVFVGYNAGYSIGISDNGDFNTTIGVGTTTFGGSSNTAIGAGAYTDNVSNSAAIGNGATVLTDNTMALGAPSSGFTVVVGRNAAALDGFGNHMYGFEINGDGYANSGIWIASDEKLKKDIKTFANGTEMLRKLNPVKYEYKDDIYFDKQKGDTSAPVLMNFAKGQQYGFLAKDLEIIIPSMVKTRSDGYKNVNYNHLFGVLVQGFKEQDEVVTQNTQKINELTNEVASLKEANALMLGLVQDIQRKLDALSGIQPNNEIGTTLGLDDQQVKSYIKATDPNPFTEQTTIKYNVVSFNKEAKLVITDDRAQLLYLFTIEQLGAGQVMLSGNSLKQGEYIAQLMVDGKVVDTKKLILIK